MTVKIAGSQRSVTPEETLRRVAPLHTRLGITRVADITGLDTIGIPVTTAVRPNARSLAVSQGKGATQAAARASAVMEAAETWHAEHLTLPIRVARWSELGDEALDPARLPAAPGSPYRPDLPLPWVSGTDLGSGRQLLVPFDVVHTDWTLPPGWADGCFPADSNGLAGGNTLAEAVTSALCELVERDAAALWADHEDQDSRRLDPSTVDDDTVRALLDRYERAGVAVAVWDLTADTGVPVMLCHAVERDENIFRPLPAAGGLGCHPDATTALVRALTEAAQSRLIAIAGARDDLYQREYSRALDPAAAEAARRAIVKAGRTAPWAALPGFGRAFATDRVGDDLALLRGRVAAAAHVGRIAVVDLTHAEVGLPVVRVVAEGLEGAGAIYGGGSVPGIRATAPAGESS